MTFGSGGQRSIQLSYGRLRGEAGNGAPKRIIGANASPGSMRTRCAGSFECLSTFDSTNGLRRELGLWVPK